MPPTIAVLIPHYNDSDTVAQTLRCIREQTVPFDEIVVVDDASEERHFQALKQQLAEFKGVRLFRNPVNLGVVATGNYGITLVQSDYVHMMSANDTYSLHIVEYAKRAASAQPGVAMISGNSAAWDAVRGKPAPDMIMRLEQVEAFISPQEYARLNRIAPVSANGGANTMHCKTYLALGGQDIRLAWYADWFLYFLIGLTHGFYYIPQFYTTYRIEGKKSFSYGRFDWKREKPALLNMLTLLREKYPSQAQIFRETALFPHYSLRILFTVCTEGGWWFVTPLFIWRCFGHQAAFWLKSVLPRPFLMRVRSLFRL
jgi:glycosyltransferase involved in cell wall biosynthesis